MASSTLVLEQSLLRRALAARDPGRLHVRFNAAVVDRYRGMPGAQLLRTRTVGRLTLPGRWSLDIGIVDGEEPEVHAPVQDLIDRLPEAEWPHWIEHLVESPASANFIQMRMTPAACIDDGETADWR
ncbi:MAG: hypothetical protein FJZ92_00995 [Chloroflexi bacterium]|nr:hypothetical protein [Chloroflexota bacterium]